MNNPLGGPQKREVCYYYDDDIGSYQFSQGHPMKPFKIKMTDSIIKAYGMDKMMKSIEVDKEFVESLDLTVFHSDDYIDILKTLTPENKDLYAD